MIHQLGLARRFKKEAETTLTLDPNHVRALHTMIDFYMQAPGVVGSDKAKARAIADQLMKIDPAEGYRAQVTLARYDKQEGRIEELLRKAVEARPASYDARMAFGNVTFGNIYCKSRNRNGSCQMPTGVWGWYSNSRAGRPRPSANCRRRCNWTPTRRPRQS